MSRSGPTPGPIVGETALGDELPHDDAGAVGEDYGGAALDSARLQRARARSVVLAGALSLLAAVIGWSVVVDRAHPWFQPFDDGWRIFVIGHRNGPATTIAKTLSVVGSVYITLPLRLGVAVVLGLRRRWLQLGAFASAVLVSEVLVGVIKAAVDRPRPTAPMVLATGSSFPSGHAIATAVTAFGIIAAFLPRGRRRWHWIVVASTLAGLMSLSRTYLSVHWATDTIAGTAIGVACAIAAEALFEGGRHAVALEELRD